MAEVRYPSAVWDPGVNAGYTNGYTRMQTAKWHYTVGRDSTRIGRQGYFQFLQCRDGELVQFCEVDAKCWDAGDFNGVGPAIEIEYHPDYDQEIVTPEARESLRGLVAWLHEEWKLPLTYFDVETLPERVDAVPPGFGFISHRSFDQAPDNHTDYIPQEDWLAITAPPIPAPILNGEEMIQAVADTNGNVHLFVVGTDNAVYYKRFNSDGTYDPPGANNDYVPLGGQVRA